MKNNRLIFIVGFFLILLAIYSFIVSRNRDSDSLPRTSILTLEADNVTPIVGGEFVVAMNLDSNDTEVAAADFVLNFDPEYLDYIENETGGFFSEYPINTKGENFVKISGVATFDGDKLILPKGKGSVGMITFKAKKQGKTAISFDLEKTVVATDGQNILNNRKLPKLEVNISD